MLIRKLAVEVDAETWGHRPVPRWLIGSSTQNMDLAKALLMLGTLTLPGMISSASPAILWAWVRYFLSIAGNDDFRITRDFSELDPHQKGILSDDLGVALSTQWLFDRLGGFKSILDGRFFMLQFPDLLRTKTKAPTAKVGPSKAPDYVVLDKSNKWHVLECKGTQSGPGFRDRFLKDALPQKHVIQINGAIRGERLAAGLSISHEDQRLYSSLRVVDPEVDPILTLESSQASEMESKAHRLSVASALGMIGLSDVAAEFSLPPNALEAKDYLQRVERRRVRETAESRNIRATTQLRERSLARLEFRSRKYEGRRVTIDLPEVGGRFPFNSMVIRQGVDADLLRELNSAPSLFGDVVDGRIDERLSQSEITSESDELHAILVSEEVLFSEITFKKT